MSTKVVIIGGSYSAARAAKAILGEKSNIAIDLTVLAPSEYSLNTVATPRILIEPEKIDKLFFNLAKQLKSSVEKVPGSKHTVNYVKAYATNVDLESKTVHYDGDAQGSLSYDYLVIATGDSSSSHFKLTANKDHEYTKAAILGLSKKISQAKTVAVIGGGATGVEVAGELAEHYSSSKVTLITGSSGPLSFITGSTPKTATKQLEALGVTVVNSKKVASHTEKSVVYQDGATSSFDIVIPAFSSHANSSFLPKDLLDSRGYVVTDNHLNIPHHPEVLVYGDIVSGGSRTILELEYGGFPAVLKSWVSTVVYRVPESTLKEYKKPTHTSMIIVPISRRGGIMHVFGWNFPNFFVRLLKAKAFMVDETTKMFS